MNNETPSPRHIITSQFSKKAIDSLTHTHTQTRAEKRVKFRMCVVRRKPSLRSFPDFRIRASAKALYDGDDDDDDDDELACCPCECNQRTHEHKQAKASMFMDEFSFSLPGVYVYIYSIGAAAREPEVS